MLMFVVQVIVSGKGPRTEEGEGITKKAGHGEVRTDEVQSDDAEQDAGVVKKVEVEALLVGGDDDDKDEEGVYSSSSSSIASYFGTLG